MTQTTETSLPLARQQVTACLHPAVLSGVEPWNFCAVDQYSAHILWTPWAPLVLAISASCQFPAGRGMGSYKHRNWGRLRYIRKFSDCLQASQLHLLLLLAACSSQWRRGPPSTAPPYSGGGLYPLAWVFSPCTSWLKLPNIQAISSVPTLVATGELLFFANS